MIVIKPDKPITSKDNDDLKRKQFAIDLAEMIVNYNSTESLVVGIYGCWGDGKTSIINMAKETISELNKQKESTIVIDFNPWIYSGATELSLIFLETLRKELSKNTIIDKDKIIELLAEYIAIIDFIPSTSAETILVKSLIKIGLKNIAKKIKRKREHLKSNVLKIKDDINNILEKINKKIVFVIDDIDRLTPEEIRIVFKLIRMVADFKNTIYLLAFDFKIVSSSLENETTSVQGKEYLNKIIQIPLQTPYAQQEDIAKILLDGINDVFSLDKIKFKWESTHDLSLYQLGWMNSFKTLRSVKRFINLLQFEYSKVKDKINRADFLVITSFKLFYPKEYDLIYQYKDLLTGTRRTFASIVEETKKADKIAMEELFNEFNKEFKINYANLLAELFPYIKFIFDNTHLRDEEIILFRKEGRICAIENFDLYYSLQLPDNYITSNEIKNIILEINEQQDFEKVLLSLNQKGSLWTFLYQFRDYRDDISQKSIPIIISSFLNIGDQLAITSREINAMPVFSSHLVIFIIFDLLKSIVNESDRFEVIKEALIDSKSSLTNVVMVVNELEGNYNNRLSDDDPKSVFHDKSYIDLLMKLAVNKIRDFSDKDKLNSARDLELILLCYKDWESDTIIYDSIFDKLTKTNDDLINLLQHFVVNTNHYSKDIFTGSVLSINFKSLNKLTTKVKIDEIQKRLEEVIQNISYKTVEQENLCKLFIKDSIDQNESQNGIKVN